MDQQVSTESSDHAGIATALPLGSINGFNDTMMALVAVLDLASVACTNQDSALCDQHMAVALNHCRELAEVADGYAQELWGALKLAHGSP